MVSLRNAKIGIPLFLALALLAIGGVVHLLIAAAAMGDVYWLGRLLLAQIN